MKTQTKHTRRTGRLAFFPKRIILGLMLINALTLFGQKGNSVETSENKTNDMLMNQYIESKGNSIIVFDASNIKQFWVDKSVVSRNNNIELYLNKMETIPLKIQLANVIETQDCNIEVISENPDLSFSITNNQSKAISTSTKADDFIQNHIFQSTFHIEDTEDFSFNILFSSDTSSILTIKKILLTFSDNKQSIFKGSPGFEQLLKIFERSGISVPDNDIQYIFSKDMGGIFVKIPKEIASNHNFYFQCYPIEQKDLEPERVQYGYNQHIFSVKTARVVIPKPYFLESDYTIIRHPLPSYPFSKIRFGQYTKEKKLWSFVVENK